MTTAVLACLAALVFIALLSVFLNYIYISASRERLQTALSYAYRKDWETVNKCLTGGLVKLHEKVSRHVLTHFLYALSLSHLDCRVEAEDIFSKCIMEKPCLREIYDKTYNIDEALRMLTESIEKDSDLRRLTRGVKPQTVFKFLLWGTVGLAVIKLVLLLWSNPAGLSR
jgi:hypothetical protein